MSEKHTTAVRARRRRRLFPALAGAVAAMLTAATLAVAAASAPAAHAATGAGYWHTSGNQILDSS